MAEHVLMIEDDASLAALVAEYLAGFGLRVRVAGSGAEGLRMIAAGGFDALILDVMLPDANGFDLCRQIRAHDDMPILMLTARGLNGLGR
jgi:two-component system, OmpR family, phosphate regulon response regulator OmpR